jgi:hypothetical protein
MAKVRSVDFLPEIFQTKTNRQFLGATLDQLVQEPALKKTQGFIGRKIGPGINPTDAKYVVEPTAERTNYQLEPAVAIKVPDTDTVIDAITYPGIVDALQQAGADVTSDDRLYSSQYYAFDPLIDYDKLVNYSEYYWLPTGPLSVDVTGGTAAISRTIDVTRNNNFYSFSGQLGQNPTLTLVRGGSYRFEIAQNKTSTVNLRVTNQTNKAYVIDYVLNPNLTLVRGNTYIFTLSIAGNFPFWIKTIASTGVVNVYDNGVTNNGANEGTVIFTVPQNAPDLLYYSSETSAQMTGTFSIIDGEAGSGPQFFIQAQPGIDGRMPTTPNISSRDVLGVINNGEDLGTVTFNVPNKTAQNFYYTLNELDPVDLVSDIPYRDINHAYVEDFFAKYPDGIDGITDLDGKYIIFNIKSIEGAGPFQVTPNTAEAGGWLRASFYSPTPSDDEQPGYNERSFSEVAEITSLDERYSIWQINYVTDQSGRQYLNVTSARAVNKLEKFRILEGSQYSSTQWYRTDDSWFEQIPLLTAILDTLYYQDSVDPQLVGELSLIEPEDASALNVNNIIGAKQYTSPNGVTFSNGLVVTFRGDITPVEYLDNTYYVEGVGESIVLVPVVDTITPESYTESVSVSFDSTPYDIGNYDVSNNQPLTPDYITINRASPDRNAWSRSNRWFHRQVLETSAELNNNSALLDLQSRARRPIVEFKSGMKLYNFGTSGKRAVDVIDFTTLDAFSDVNGTPLGYVIDGYNLVDGSRVIFAADTDLDVRNKVYRVQVISPDTVNPLIKQPIINLVPAEDTIVLSNDVVVCLNGVSRKGQSFTFDGEVWTLSQQKTGVNDPPLFDIYLNDFSIGNLERYPSSTFKGSKLFSYGIGSGTNDPVLGFPVEYVTINNVGDIVFVNNYYKDTFSYVVNRQSITESVGKGFARRYTSRTEYTDQIGWATAPYASQTYQQFEFTYQGLPLLLDVKVNDLVLDSSLPNPYPVIKLYIGATFQDPGTYSYTTTANTTTINLSNGIVQGEKIIVLILSDQVSATAFFQVPANLQNNALNSEVSQVTLGTMRSHYESICQNLIDIQGTINGANNSRDLGYIARYGLNILQQSSPLTMAGYFLRDPDFDLFRSLQWNSAEYVKFKTQILDGVAAQDWGNATPPEILTAVVNNINLGRTQQNPFYWSDMLPVRTVYDTNTYVFTPISQTTFNTLRVYNFTQSNYQGLLIYLNGRLLTINKDYTVSADTPQVTITIPLAVGDQIEIQEYSSTIGSFVPNTPTKMGLYPAFQPKIYLDTTYSQPTPVILGHDGSITVAFDDIRDQVLLDFETRIYNNLKVRSIIPIQETDIIPGQFRTTDYTLGEVNDILSVDFLTWVGTNKIDYAVQAYDVNNQFSYNYSRSENRLDNEVLPVGAWRGLYLWFYDTIRPHQAPWEMLGFTEQPTWWEDQYGAAPYTSDNLVLWEDLAAGRVADPAGAYILPRYARPGLLDVLPVNAQGQLLSPLNSVVGIYDRQTFQRSWRIGDVGPVEYVWRTSSSYPFAIMRLLALTRPAEFFSLFVDRDLYKFNTTIGQYLYDQRSRLVPANLELYGSGVSKASYVNWIVDYNTHLGNSNTSNTLGKNLANIDVRLAYRMASFSDKGYIKVYLEKPSPNSLNTSLLLPDDSYELFLYKNQSFARVKYSSVMIQKVVDGYQVFGYDVLNPYFEILTSKVAGPKITLSAGGKSVAVPTTYSDTIAQVPYGYIFTNDNAVCDFLFSYGALLERQGMVFDSVENGLTLNWRQMADEFLYWSGQGWGPGSVINLNPANTSLMVSRLGAVVDSVIERDTTTSIQDQNKRKILVNDLIIERIDNEFKMTSLTEQTLNFANLNFTAYEHIMVLKNISVFGDLIYDPVTAARQGRIQLIAATSTDWNGQLDAQGFILNQDNIVDWQANVTYTKGQIVKFKNQYYSALTIVQPKQEFDYVDWTLSDYNKVQKGLLPNLANKADLIQQTYNTVGANLERDQDLLAYGLIGFRPREYMANLNLGDVSQVNVYKQFLGSKGTKFSVDLFGNASFDKEVADYKIYENWAVLKGLYGAQANRRFFDIRLNQAQLTSNPSTVEIITPFEQSSADQTIQVQDLWRSSWNVTSPDILPSAAAARNDLNLPTSGYVNLSDVDITEFDIDNSTNLNANIDSIGVGTTVWIAKINSHDWNVYRCSPVPGKINSITENYNGTCVVEFSQQHGLDLSDVVVIKSFSVEVNGAYRVLEVPSLTSIVIRFTLLTDQVQLLGQGTCLVLDTVRVAQPSDIADLSYINSVTTNSLVWVDNDGADQWEVLQRTEPFDYNQRLEPLRSVNAYWASAVAQLANNTLMLASAPGSSTGIVYQYGVNPAGSLIDGGSLSLNASQVSNFGACLTVGDNLYGAAGAPNSFNDVGYAAVLAYVGDLESFTVSQLLLALDQPGPSKFGSSMVMSQDERWLYIGAPAHNRVYAYGQVPVPTQKNTYPTDGQTRRYSTARIQIDNPQQLLVTVSGLPQRLNIDYTVGSGFIDFVATPSKGLTVEISRRQSTQLDFYEYYNILPATTTGIGIGAAFDIDVVRTQYSAVLSTTGSNYSVGEILTIKGTQIGGSSPAEDCVITITDVTFAGAIVDFTISGQRLNIVDRFPVQESLFTATNINSVTVTVNNVIQRPKIDYEWLKSDSSLPDSTLNDYDIVFVNSPAVGATIMCYASTYYAYSDVITVSGLESDAGFGSSVSTNRNGSQLIVGCPKENVNSTFRSGAAYLFNRDIERFIITVASDSPTTVNIPATLRAPTAVKVNNQFLNNTAQYGTFDSNTFTVNYSVSPENAVSVTINQPLAIGDVLDIESNVFKPVQKIVSDTVQERAEFGHAVQFTLDDSEIAVGTPYDSEFIPQAGSVKMFVNQAASYGTITSTNTSPTLTAGHTIQINNQEIAVPAAPNNTVEGLAAYINNSFIPNVRAVANNSGTLTIAVLNKDSTQPYNRLLVMPGSTGTAFTDLGFNTLEYVQTLISPYATDGANFGFTLASYSQDLMIGAPGGTPHIAVTFDGGTTFFDAGSTTFYTDLIQTGVVYEFDYLPAANESLMNPGKFGFGEQIYSSDSVQNENFGASISQAWAYTLVGSPQALVSTSNNNGAMSVFINADRTPSWIPKRYQVPAVDIYSLNNALLYDRLQSPKTLFLDFFNPTQGKILSAARQNIDFVTTLDPAFYNSGLTSVQGNSWGREHLGQIWWDTSSVRYLDVDQDDLVYASRRWGQVFPGSVVDIYQWVESSVPPANYPGPGIPLNIVDYTVLTNLSENNVFVSNFYFWVRNLDTVASDIGKTLSTRVLSQYLENPIASGIPFLAPLNSSTLAFYNCRDYIRAYDTICHIDFDQTPNDANIHSEFQLLAENKDTAFLTPQLYRKLQDSFAGEDQSGLTVPDPSLTVAERYGVQFRPRQSMFVDRFTALENYINRTNEILSLYPIAESRVLSLLNSQEPVPLPQTTVGNILQTNWNQEVANLEELSWQNILIVPVGYKYLVLSDSSNSGRWTIYETVVNRGVYSLRLVRVQNYRTNEFWQYVNWYQPGFNQDTTPNIEVPSYAALIAQQATVGTVALVTANSQGKFEIYQLSDSGWNRVALQDGTIQILDTIYDYALGRLGFDGEVFDAQYFDQAPQIETRKIVQSINQELFIDELLIERNKLLILMFNYIFTEQLSPDWLLKTSLIDVQHNIRELLPYQTYRRDNQDFVLNYLNEVKPYHVQIREFNLKYAGQDLFNGDIADFDIPAYFNTDYNAYISPILSETGTEPSDAASNNIIWQTQPYDQWFNNYKLELESLILISGGSGYTTAPTVTITGIAIRNATATAVINSAGQVNALVIADPGEGYLTTPVVTITGGNGTGAKAIALLNNGLVRSIKTTIKYDRYQYKTDILEWQPNITFDNGQLVRYADKIWEADSPDSTGVNTPEFIPEDWILVPVDELSGVDRTMGYYVALADQPGRELPLLISGVDYPGVQVKGLSFDQDTGYARGPFDMTPWDNLGFSESGRPTYSDVIIDSIYQSEFIDQYLGTGVNDVIVDGGEFIDPYSSHAPEELVPGSEFDTLDFKVFVRPGSDWNGTGHGFDILTLRSTFSSSDPEIDWSLIALYQNDEIYPAAIRVSNAGPNGNPLQASDLDPSQYSVDWVNQTITITSGAADNDTMVVTVYEVGGGNQLLRANYNGADIGTHLDIDVKYSEINELVIFVNGQRLLANIDYTYAALAVGRTRITFTVILTSLDAVNLTVMGLQTPQYSWSLPTVQVFNITETAPLSTAQLTYTLTNSLQGSNPDNAYVTVNGFRARPPQGIEWYGDGSSAEFLFPERGGYSQGLVADNEVDVYVNDVPQTLGSDFTVVPWDGFSRRSIILSYVPNIGDRILICINSRSDYIISGNQITFRPSGSFGVFPGDTVAVTTYNDTSQQQIVQIVWVGPITVGATAVEGFDLLPFDNGTVSDESGSFDFSEGITVTQNDFDLRRPSQLAERMIVSLNGRLLFPGLDYTVVVDDEFGDVTSYLELLSGPITATDVVVATLFTNQIVPNAMAFRIFQDMRGVALTYRITEQSTTVLTQALGINDDIIYVENALACGAPDIISNYLGVVIINGERITFRSRDLVNNTLSGLMRGTAGTAIATHEVNTPVYNMGRENLLSGGGYQDHVDQTTILSNGSQTVFTASNINLLGVDSTEWLEALIVSVGGIIQPYTAYEFLGANPASIRFYEAPPAGRQVTLAVKRAQSWYEPGASTPSNGLPLQLQTTAAAKFLRNAD